MLKQLEQAVVSAALLAAFGFATHAGAASDSACFEDWSDAAPIVAQEQLQAVRDMHMLARQHLSGELIRITLCREDARYIYRLLVRSANGRMSHLTVDAARPFEGQAASH